jgi:serine/threonine-protein kinase
MQADWDNLINGVLHRLDEIEAAADALDGAADELVDGLKEKAQASVASEEMPTRAEVLMAVLSMPDVHLETLIEDLTHLLATPERGQLAQRIVAGLPEEEREKLDAACAALDEKERRKQVKEWLRGALVWVVLEVLEVVVQGPFEPLVGDMLRALGRAGRAATARADDVPQPVVSPLPVPPHSLAPEMVTVPAGRFWMGTDRRRLERAGVEWRDWMEDELPYHQVYLPEYEIGRYPVTNAEYEVFVRDTGRGASDDWDGGVVPQGTRDHPVVYVSWHDAVAYCQWLSERTGLAYRLPSEAEWEKAARGTDGRLWPWGDTRPTERLCNCGDNVGDTTPVGRYSPAGDSPYGCADMAGNVFEWTRSIYRPYWGAEVDAHRVLRGGTFPDPGWSCRCAYRSYIYPNFRYGGIGFRVVLSPFPLDSDTSDR